MRDLANKAAADIVNQIQANSSKKTPPSTNITTANSSSTCPSKSQAPSVPSQDQDQDQDGQEETSILDQFLCDEEAGSVNDQFEEDDDNNNQFENFPNNPQIIQTYFFSQWQDDYC